MVSPLPLLSILVSTSILAYWLRRRFHRGRPSGEQVLAIGGEPRILVPSSKTHAAVNHAVAAEIREQLLSGRQLGLHVVAYHRGVRVVDVVGGVRRCAVTGKWVALESDALYMSFSVCKGVSATALLALADKGHFDYEQPVSKIWPEFAPHGKDQLTIECAVSHRDGVRRVPLRSFVSLILAKAPAAKLWRVGEQFVEDYIPDWQPGTKAMYNPLTWSWIIGGIVTRATNGQKNIHQAVHEDVADVLSSRGDMHLGHLPSDQLARVALREPTVNFRSGMGWQPLKRMAAHMEANILCAIGNSRWWSRLCLPSSNGYFTADAVARMYGALANNGSVYLPDTSASEKRLVSENAVSDLIGSLVDENKYLHHPASAQRLPARMSRGYGPWPFPSHTGENAHRCFGHSGLGGCVGFSDPDARLAICVMKTGYDPHAIVGESGSPDAARLCKLVREHLQA